MNPKYKRWSILSLLLVTNLNGMFCFIVENDTKTDLENRVGDEFEFVYEGSGKLYDQ